MDIDWPALKKMLEGRFALEITSIHGPAHWQRVERYAIDVARHSGGAVLVGRLFAALHDVCRQNDARDAAHGAHAAALATQLRGVYYDLPDEDFVKLQYACTWHTAGRISDDPTIGACWDADRLDLWRVDITPRAELMSTSYARALVHAGKTGPQYLPDPL